MNALRRHQLAHPTPAETALGDRVVACGCDAKLHLPVLLDALGVSACMKCGTTTYAQQRGDDGRYTGESSTVYFAIGLPKQVMEWLTQWPRVLVRRESVLWPMPAAWVVTKQTFFPAKCTFRSNDHLEQVVSALHPDQQVLSMRGQLIKAGYPDAEPPEALPTNLQAFASVRQAMQLTVASDVSLLMQHAQLGSASSAIAADLLMQRADATDILTQAMHGHDRVWFSAGIAMFRASRQTLPVSPSTMIELLNAVPLTPLNGVPDRIEQWSRFELLLLAIAEQKMNTPDVRAGLRSIMRKVARHDSSLVNRLRTVIQLLETPA